MAPRAAFAPWFRTARPLRKAFLAPVGGFLAAAALVVWAAAADAAVRADLWVANGPVHALALDDGRGVLYLGGDFTELRHPQGAAPPVMRSRLAALDLESGAPTGWDPGADAVVRALWLAPDGETLYVGGDFTAAGGQNRARIAALRTDTGAARAWNPGADGPVHALETTSSPGISLYAGGGFSVFGGAARHGLAEIRLDAPIVTPLGETPLFAPGADIRALGLAPGRLYVGGTFTVAGGDATRRLAAVDLTTLQVAAWAPPIGDGRIDDLLYMGHRNVLFAAGTFTTIGGVTHVGAAAFEATQAGEVLGWDPRLDGPVRSLAASLDRVAIYLGGDFGEVAGIPRAHLAAVNAFDASPVDWDGVADDEVLALATREDMDVGSFELFAGGVFTTVDGAPRAGVAGLTGIAPEEEAPSTHADPPAGFFNSSNVQAIRLVCDDGAGSGCAATYYTLDGTDPDTDSTRYVAPINVTANAEIRYFSIDNVGNREAVRSDAYEFELNAPVTTANPRSQIFERGEIVVTLSCTDPAGGFGTGPGGFEPGTGFEPDPGGGPDPDPDTGEPPSPSAASGCAATYYTTDGTLPTTASPQYEGPIRITRTTVLQYFSVDLAGNVEGVRRSEYVQNRGEVGALGWAEALALLAALGAARRHARARG